VNLRPRIVVVGCVVFAWRSCRSRGVRVACAWRARRPRGVLTGRLSFPLRARFVPVAFPWHSPVVSVANAWRPRKPRF